jgi:hypothetical protein
VPNSKPFKVLTIIQVLSISLWAGGTTFFTFVAAPRIFEVLAGQLPGNPPPGVVGITPEIGNRLAGDTVGAIFPAYFTLQIIAGCAACVCGVLLARGTQQRLAKIRVTMIAVALAVVTAHALTVYPQSVRVSQARHQAQDSGDESRAAALRREFGMLHGISQSLNLVVILIVITCLVLIGLNPAIKG